MTTGFRKRFTFWLNLDRDDQLEIAETIEDLKSRRKFVSTVRDGIRLIVDLSNGNTDVLFELFPELRKMLETPPPDLDGFNELKNEIKTLKDALLSSNAQADYRMMETQQVPVVMAPRPKTKPVSIDEPKTNGKSDGSSANNLLASLASF